MGVPALYWEENPPILRVGFGLQEDLLKFLDADEESRKHIGRALKDIYRYDGPFSVSHNAPF